MRLSAHDLHGPKSQRFNVERSNFEIAEKYPMKVFPTISKPRSSKRKPSLMKTLSLVPANITAVAHPAGQ
jgi:hypothetical protein